MRHCFFWHLAKEIRATAKEILGFLAELPKNFEKIFSLSAKKCEHFQAKCQRNFGKFGSNAKGLLPEKKTVRGARRPPRAGGADGGARPNAGGGRLLFPYFLIFRSYLR